VLALLTIVNERRQSCGLILSRDNLAAANERLVRGLHSAN
jgi:hypothetical protein